MQNLNRMRNALTLLAVFGLAAFFTAGCAGPEQKLGRGLNNTLEIARWDEMRRSVEQTTVFEGTGVGMTTGVIRGFDRTMARTGIGLYEVVTAPFPSYDPICTKYLPVTSVGPDSYTPGLPADPLFETDTYTGYSGGEAVPFIPGSRFSVFEN